MATLVFFHAHPDDESIATGGTMAAAADAGHRVVLVLATRGELGEVAEGFLHDGESLKQRRVAEVKAAADILGVHTIEFLGYRDSGMMGEPTNEEPSSFWRANLDEAATRLAAILDREDADVLSVYDEIGGYGHPDHLQVHRVGHRAAEQRPTAVVESTINRDHFLRVLAAAEEEIDAPDIGDDFGMPENRITTRVDVTPWIERKLAAMRAHASQIPEDSFFLTMPPATFAESFGVEWFIRPGVPTPVDAFDTSIVPVEP